MKKKDLIREIQRLGWYLLREGSRHEIWTNGLEEEAIPRHREIHEVLARKILRSARGYPGKQPGNKSGV